MEKSIRLDALTMGVCYYPEHWDRALWASDLQRMLGVGIRVIRIAEFAWNKFEPVEGRYSFAFFDAFMEVVRQTEMKVIFCTPTATPPAWASENYPEILNATKEGVLYRHGERRHYNYNSEKYNHLTQLICEQLARHYGHDASIIGWQLDNEINCQLSEFYSEADTRAFRVFLQAKYGTLDALNAAWGTTFWNQDYTDWAQVHLPRKSSEGGNNQHQVLDYIRFVSDSACRFAALQSQTLRKHIDARQFITTNGLFGNLDNHKMTEDSLDFMTFDHYPNFANTLTAPYGADTGLRDRQSSMRLMEVRAVSPNFGIMEQQSGANGWVVSMEASMPKPGQMTLWTLQSIAHGADFISFFRWRTCTIGMEIYWHGILDYNNRDNRRLAEVRDIHDKMERIRGIQGAKYVAGFAIVKEYDNSWDAQYDAWHRRVEAVSSIGWFAAAQHTHTPFDYLYIQPETTLSELSRYPVLVYPHATLLKDSTAALLKAYVNAGGVLVLGCRSGYKDETGKCRMNAMTGAAAELTGADLEDYTLVGPYDGKVRIDWDGDLVEAAVFNDVIEPMSERVEVLGRYDANYYAGKPGLTLNRIGQGKVYYFGAAFDESAATLFLRKLNLAAPFAHFVDAPAACEIAVREKNGQRFLFVLNYTDAPQTIHVKRPATDCFTGREVAGELQLAPYGTAAYKLLG